MAWRGLLGPDGVLGVGNRFLELHRGLGQLSRAGLPLASVQRVRGGQRVRKAGTALVPG